MSKIRILLVAFALYIAMPGTNAQDNRVIRDVILLNVQPYEVLMTKEGDVVAKIRHIPNYLTSGEKVKPASVNPSLAAGTETRPVEPEEQGTQVSDRDDPSHPYASNGQDMLPKFDYFEVIFSKGTATLSAESLSTLNELATMLKANPGKMVQMFGFQNETPLVATLLSKRRQDACVAYLKIKGVQVSKQVLPGNVTEGTNNKIVFGFQ